MWSSSCHAHFRNLSCNRRSWVHHNQFFKYGRKLLNLQFACLALSWPQSTGSFLRSDCSALQESQIRRLLRLFPVPVNRFFLTSRKKGVASAGTEECKNRLVLVNFIIKITLVQAPAIASVLGVIIVSSFVPFPLASGITPGTRLWPSFARTSKDHCS